VSFDQAVEYNFPATLSRKVDMRQARRRAAKKGKHPKAVSLHRAWLGRVPVG
jgi:hypothetical protein